ncbi:MAG TPA: hypothetical protein VFH45_11090, partial [Acidimicrobiales bacterium]|nr:hypothetical protein [Acidimicrobiales bacterium]
VRAGARPVEPAVGVTRDVLDVLHERGALFIADIREATRRLPSDVEAGLWDGVARGLVTADGFAAVRSLLASRQTWAHRSPRRGLRRAGPALGGRAPGGGRWSLLPPGEPADDADELAEAVAEQLLARWGVVFRDLLAREPLVSTWRDILWALRRMEARGTVRGGRFVSGFAGEQYALPEAVDMLRQVRRSERSGEVVMLSAADPLNLVGIITPGPRVTAVRTQTVAYRDGVPVEPGSPEASTAPPRLARAGSRPD